METCTLTLKRWIAGRYVLHTLTLSCAGSHPHTATRLLNGIFLVLVVLAEATLVHLHTCSLTSPQDSPKRARSPRQCRCRCSVAMCAPRRAWQRFVTAN